MANTHICTHFNPNHQLFCRINKVESGDPKTYTDLQKQHLPIIVAPQEGARNEPIKISVDVGKLMKHPNEQAHHIQWIELWQREAFIARIDLTPELSEPSITVTAKLDHPWPLIARARCNQHGIWEAQVSFDIKD